MPHVLVVDDSPIVCQLLRIELAPFDIEVSTADDIEGGAEKLLANAEIGVVMLDLSVAETQGGRATLREFSRAGNRVPVILQSAISDDELKAKVSEMGADGYFRKGSDLIRLVNQIIHLSK